MISCLEYLDRLYEYKDEKFTFFKCWKCGHYESDSPPYKSCPELFRNLLREKASILQIFIIRKLSGEFLERDESDEDLTAPNVKSYSGNLLRRV